VTKGRGLGHVTCIWILGPPISPRRRKLQTSRSYQWGRWDLRAEPSSRSRADEVKAIWLNSKLETVKTINAPRKINAILLNINTTRPKLVYMCG